MLWSLLHFLSNKSWQVAVFSHKMYLHVGWHITLSYLSHPCLKCCLFKHLTRDKSLAWVCFSLLFGPSEQELLWQSWTRKEPTEKKQRDGQTSSRELLPMLWQGLQQWLMWATGPGQTLGFHSGCMHVPGCVADGNGGERNRNEADWHVGANMPVGITRGEKHWTETCFYGAIKSRDYLQ